MKRLIISTLCISFIHLVLYSQGECTYSENYVPKNIKESLLYLDCVWSDKGKEDFKRKEENNATSELHFGTGLALRNGWGFWEKKKNSLVKQLNSMGITHPDGMSSAILTLYHRKLNNNNFNLEEEILKYKKLYSDIKKEEKEFDRKIKQKFDSLSVGYIIKVPFSINSRTKNKIHFGIYSNRSDSWHDTQDCIITCKIEKKRKTRKNGFPLTLKIIDIWFANEQDYIINIEKKIGDIFIYDMQYFVILTK